MGTPKWVKNSAWGRKNIADSPSTQQHGFYNAFKTES